MGKFGSREGGEGATGMAFLRNCQKLPPCLIEPMPAISKMDLSVAKVEPITDGSSTSGITDLRRGKNNLGNSN